MNILSSENIRKSIHNLNQYFTFSIIAPVYAASAAPSAPVAITTWSQCTDDGTPTGVPTLRCLELVYGNILSLSSYFIILVLFIMFVVGGYNYLTSFGSPDKVKKAQTTLRFAIIGFVLYLSAFLILKTIQFLFLDGSSFNLFNFTIGGP